MEITYVNSITVEDYNYLRKSVGWYEVPAHKVKRGLDNSTYIIAAKYEGKTVGMARVVSDGGCVALIVDVIVHPKYQGKGIGTAMMNMVMEYLHNNLDSGEGISVILMTAKGKEAFYKKFGFIERPNEKLGAGMSMWLQKQHNND